MWVDKQIMVYLYNGISLGNKKNELLIRATAWHLYGVTFLKALSAFEGFSVKKREREKGDLALI